MTEKTKTETKARSCRLHFSMDADAAEWWKAKAAEMGVDMGDLMRGALEAWKENAEKDGAGLRFAKVEEMPLWLTPKECAKIMGLHHLTVLKWIRTGVIPSRKFGSRRMVSRDFFGSGSFPWTRNGRVSP